MEKIQNKSVSLYEDMIAREEQKIEKIYTEIGKAFYGRFGKSPNLDAPFKKLCGDIQESNENIQGWNQEILALQNMVICPGCGRQSSKDNIFCTACGTRIKLQPQEFRCSKCGTEIGEADAFCFNCGNKLK